MRDLIFILLIQVLPLLAFLFLALMKKKWLAKSAGIISTMLILISCFLAVSLAYQYFFKTGFVNGSYQQILLWRFNWLSFGNGLSIDMGFVLNPISAMMMVVVTFISLMVHIYSIGYMKGEKRYATYFSFLSLFTFSMLGLVIASNIFQMYIFWELVGLSSFLLIGFYYDRPAAVAACKKAFIVTRFADLGFLIGILVLSFYAGTLDINTLIQRLTASGSIELKSALSDSFLGVSALTWGLILVFIGGAGKSAMFPLHIWLPDAMEGPTPVSALIHAATMVVAGVFLVARLFPVFAISAPDALQLVAYTGIISAAIAAVIACTQTDIKRVLAYSTMSQIGYMMFALGVAKYGGEESLGYTASMFHLFTHAIFKALLFLGAGAIIHFIHSNEIKDMGGLRKYLPATHITFLIACLAIAGIPPFAGFFSKEEILLAAFQNNKAIYWVALFTSGLTAFYMFRLYFTIFWNRQNHSVENNQLDHKKEKFTIVLPLVILAIGAASAGFIPFGNFISADGSPLHTGFNLAFSIAPVTFAVAGFLIAMWFYKKQNEKPARLTAQLGAFYKTVYHKFYIDELYLLVTRKVVFNLIGKPAAWFDKNVVDGVINLSGNTTQLISHKIKGFQSGKVQQYAIYFLVGVIGLITLFIYVWK